MKKKDAIVGSLSSSLELRHHIRPSSLRDVAAERIVRRKDIVYLLLADEFQRENSGQGKHMNGRYSLRAGTTKKRKIPSTMVMPTLVCRASSMKGPLKLNSFRACS